MLSAANSPWAATHVCSPSACVCCANRGACADCVRPLADLQHPIGASVPRDELLGEVRSLRRERDELWRLVRAQKPELEEPPSHPTQAKLRGRSAGSTKSWGDSGMRIRSRERRLEHDGLIAAQEATATEPVLFNGPYSGERSAASAAALARQGAEAAELAAFQVAAAQDPWCPLGLSRGAFAGSGDRRSCSSRRPRPPSHRSSGMKTGSRNPQVLGCVQLDDAICALSTARGALASASRQLGLDAQQQSAKAWRAHRKSRQEAQQISEEAWRMCKLEQAMSASAASLTHHLRALSSERAYHPTAHSRRVKVAS